MLWFILLCIVQGIIDHAKTGCLATTKVSSEAKHENYIRGCLVHFCQLFPDFCFGDCGLPRMKNINHLRKNINKLIKGHYPVHSPTRCYGPTMSSTLKLTHLSSRNYYSFDTKAFKVSCFTESFRLKNTFKIIKSNSKSNPVKCLNGTKPCSQVLHLPVFQTPPGSMT